MPNDPAALQAGPAAIAGELEASANLVDHQQGTRPVTQFPRASSVGEIRLRLIDKEVMLNGTA